jgi:hypothetical protein
MPPPNVTLFTDPACPFAFSAEPARIRLRRHYGDGLRRTVRGSCSPARPRRPRGPASLHRAELPHRIPLATAEVAAVMRVSRDRGRAPLDGAANEHPAGADAYWTA